MARIIPAKLVVAAWGAGRISSVASEADDGMLAHPVY